MKLLDNCPLIFCRQETWQGHATGSENCPVVAPQQLALRNWLGFSCGGQLHSWRQKLVCSMFCEEGQPLFYSDHHWTISNALWPTHRWAYSLHWMSKWWKNVMAAPNLSMPRSLLLEASLLQISCASIMLSMAQCSKQWLSWRPTTSSARRIFLFQRSTTACAEVLASSQEKDGN